MELKLLCSSASGQPSRVLRFSRRIKSLGKGKFWNEAAQYLDLEKASKIARGNNVTSVTKFTSCVQRTAKCVSIWHNHIVQPVSRTWITFREYQTNTEAIYIFLATIRTTEIVLRKKKQWTNEGDWFWQSHWKIQIFSGTVVCWSLNVIQYSWRQCLIESEWMMTSWTL